MRCNFHILPRYAVKSKRAAFVSAKILRGKKHTRDNLKINEYLIFVDYNRISCYNINATKSNLTGR